MFLLAETFILGKTLDLTNTRCVSKNAQETM